MTTRILAIVAVSLLALVACERSADKPSAPPSRGAGAGGASQRP